MLRLLGKAASINVRKVLWTCAELGLEPQREDWGSGFADTRSPEFLRLNPNGLVPVLVDEAGGGAEPEPERFVLWESNSICRYLAGREGRTDLLPADPRARARVEQWMDWQAGELNNAWRYAFMARVRQSPAHRDAAEVEASIASWNHHMTLLEAQLARGGPFVTGAGFTLADIVLGLSTHRWRAAPIERPTLPALEHYYQRLCERPGFQRHGRDGGP